MNEINDQFDAIIKSNNREVTKALSFLLADMEGRDCKFGIQLIPTFIKPIFLSTQQSQNIADILSHIVNILEKVTNLYFTNPELREFFYINEKAADLIDIDQGYQRNVIICRPDSFLVNDILRFVEFNCDSPAGAGYTDIIEEIMKSSFPFQKLSDNYTFTPHHRIQSLLDALISAYHEFAGSNKKPNIAIVDWDHVRTLNEFRILQTYFKDKGFDTVIADPRELKYEDGKLRHNGFPIDLIYRRVIFKELMDHYDDVQDFLNAYKKGKVCVVNPLRSRLASNKAILSLITNPKKYKHFFTDEENHVIQKHIPWTRRVMDIQTNFDGNVVFLRKHIISHKDNLVLKPSDSYGGKDVVIGRELEQSKWDELVNRILSNGEDWVVQKYVPINEIDAPVQNNGRIELVTKKFNINPFVFNGKYAGSVSRLSDQSVINVSAGGGLVPVVEYIKK